MRHTAPCIGFWLVEGQSPLLDWARRHRLLIRLRVRVGEHVVAGTVLGWAWTVTADLPAVDPADARSALDTAVRTGFERTLEQDAALGIRQRVDMACKADAVPARPTRG